MITIIKYCPIVSSYGPPQAPPSLMPRVDTKPFAEGNIFFFSAARGSKGLRRERGEPWRPCAGGLDRLSNDKACDMKWSAFSATFSEGEHVWFQLQFFAALLPASIFLLHTFFLLPIKEISFSVQLNYTSHELLLCWLALDHTLDSRADTLENDYFGQWMNM